MGFVYHMTSRGSRFKDGAIWTGNRVTCRDWFQLSLKEGLTVFRDQQFSADMHSSAVTRIQNVRLLRSQQFAEDSGPMAHPIRPEKVLEMNNFYTLTVYEKGSEVIRMLHTLIGVEKFRLGMDLYFKRFDGMAVTCDDFINAMSDASGKDLTQFKLWYSQLGTPTVTVTESFDVQNQCYQLTLSQFSPITDEQKNPLALHIPVNIELISHTDGNNNHRELLELTKNEQTWQFNNFEEKPIVALLADFSAPVKVQFKQSDETLLLLMKTASNSFCRWDAGQKLFMSYIQKLTVAPDFVIPNELIFAVNTILSSDNDRAFIAEQLHLPSFDEAAGLIGEVEPIALINAIKKLTAFIAFGAEDKLLSCYQACQQANNTDAVANRALKNVCLHYLSTLTNHQGLSAKQYQYSANNNDVSIENMTDSLAALTCAAKNNLFNFTDDMQHFQQKWQSTTLVMDKWFVLAASQVDNSIFSQLKTLVEHRLFSLKNPNRARSLIGAFAMNNPEFFHCKTGKGYQFLAEQITELNTINPQVASRLITPLIQFKSFSTEHQALMKAQLVKLRDLSQLSNDLKEKLDAALS